MTGDPLVVELGWAGAPLAGGVSGDLHVVAPFPGGTLVAAIDGLGHGPEAADASAAAARVLAAQPGEPIALLIERCHEALRRTRGAVMTLVSFDGRTGVMSWAAVGNVEAILLRAAGGRESLTPRGGVVGYQLPTLRDAALPVSPGDVLVLASDGIRSAFVGGLAARGTPQELADGIFAAHGRGTDDALVVVARYVGILR